MSEIARDFIHTSSFLEMAVVWLHRNTAGELAKKGVFQACLKKQISKSILCIKKNETEKICLSVHSIMWSHRLTYETQKNWNANRFVNALKEFVAEHNMPMDRPIAPPQMPPSVSQDYQQEMAKYVGWKHILLSTLFTPVTCSIRTSLLQPIFPTLRKYERISYMPKIAPDHRNKPNISKQSDLMLVLPMKLIPKSELFLLFH